LICSVLSFNSFDVDGEYHSLCNDSHIVVESGVTVGMKTLLCMQSVCLVYCPDNNYEFGDVSDWNPVERRSWVGDIWVAS